MSQAYGFADKAIRCAACCVDPSPARAVAAAKRWPHLEHYWLDERAIRDLGVGRVPSRLVVDGGPNPPPLGRHARKGTAGAPRGVPRGGAGRLSSPTSARRAAALAPRTPAGVLCPQAGFAIKQPPPTMAGAVLRAGAPTESLRC